ncbi:response regulator transcription factor [Actinoplanes oblitus]|uniref:Response regulator transcription factor n=1 Tax=Actinoplanes oblitus TaxID=3040509 RepID=A0ABY8W7X0_9ACTN|nr:response regulator transcription factor [Actinoplanes oblitus]WIM93592.1 response regulator transcription factor [Actinoplanes oblitus]
MTRVLVVDDHPIMRRGLRAILEAESWVTEVLEAATVAGALRGVTGGEVDVVALDIALPDGDGIEAVHRITRVSPVTRVLMLTMSDDEDLVARALRVGAHGYVLKDTDPGAVVDALRAVASGGFVLGPNVGGSLLSGVRPRPAPLPAPFDALSARELDLLAGLAAGDSYAEIARRLGLREKTVRNRASQLFTRLAVADRVQAALLARDAGITAARGYAGC